MADPDAGRPAVEPSVVVRRAAVASTIMIVIALFHIFRVGTYLSDPWFTLYYSYFSDILLPFGIYFLLAISEVQVRLLRSWRVKALLVFGGATLTEVAQAFGIYMLGVTFDPVDIVMFGVGTLLAVFVDRVLLPDLFSFWALEA